MNKNEKRKLLTTLQLWQAASSHDQNSVTSLLHPNKRKKIWTSAVIYDVPLVYAPFLGALSSGQFFSTEALRTATLMIERGVPLPVKVVPWKDPVIRLEQKLRTLNMYRDFASGDSFMKADGIRLLAQRNARAKWTALVDLVLQMRVKRSWPSTLAPPHVKAAQLTGSFLHDVCFWAADGTDDMLLALLRAFERRSSLTWWTAKTSTALSCLCRHALEFPLRGASFLQSIRFLVEAGVDPRCQDTPWLCNL